MIPANIPQLEYLKTCKSPDTYQAKAEIVPRVSWKVYLFYFIYTRLNTIVKSISKGALSILIQVHYPD